MKTKMQQKTSNIIEFIRNKEIKWLISFPSLILVLIMIVVGNLNIDMDQVVKALIFSFICIFFAIISIMVIIKREYPFYKNLQGKSAIIIGAIGLIFSCPLAIITLLKVISELLDK